MMKSAEKRKIGIMGGTFDPIHIGHLILGEQAYEQLGLEKILFLPSGNPPHKTARFGRATDEQRVEMVRLSIADNPNFELSLAEMQDEGYSYSYTYRTLERMNREHPDEDYYFIVGADSLLTLEKWRRPDRICQNCKIVVAVRNRTPEETICQEIQRLSEKFQGTFLRLDTPEIDISSARIRKRVSENKTIRYYVPDPVRDFISQNQIYRNERDWNMSV